MPRRRGRCLSALCFSRRQVLAAVLETVKACREGQRIRQLWDHKPLAALPAQQSPEQQTQSPEQQTQQQMQSPGSGLAAQALQRQPLAAT